MIAHALATGQYPNEVVEAVNKNSEKENLKVGRLYQFNEEERKVVKGGKYVI